MTCLRLDSCFFQAPDAEMAVELGRLSLIGPSAVDEWEAVGI